MNKNLKSAEEWSLALLQEHERAIKQRDTFILTGKSTASHGGSHDTCFKHIVEQIQLNAYKAGMTEAADMTFAHGQKYSGKQQEAFHDATQSIISTRDRKESL